MSIDASKLLKYTNFPPIIQQTASDIASVTIQGATNVAIESIKAVQAWLNSYISNDVGDVDTQGASNVIGKALFYLEFLANVRPNEPLARNAFLFIKHHMPPHSVPVSLKDAVNRFRKLTDEYLRLVRNAKKNIVQKGVKYIRDSKIILTHCHSSTAEKLIVEANKLKSKTVISTETRPLYQGRITATNLLKAGVDTIMIVDSAAPGFIADDRVLPVDVILIGADEISTYGDAINKIGSFSMGLAAHYASKPLYVVTPLLKLHYMSFYQLPTIEQRDAKELWPDAPPELTIINPAFEYVPRQFIRGFLTEVGLIEPEKVAEVALKHYPWLKPQMF